jgi:hypothetical protein
MLAQGPNRRLGEMGLRETRIKLLVVFEVSHARIAAEQAPLPLASLLHKCLDQPALHFL